MLNHPQVNLFEKNRKATQLPLWLFLVIDGILIVICVVLVLLVIQSKKQVAKLEADLEKARQVQVVSNSEEDTAKIIAAVGKLIVLPADEEPTIATVNDLAQLAGQPFFEQAYIGDKVIIYNKARTAILYRPSENKVVNIAPLVTDIKTPSVSSGTLETQPANP